LNIEKENSYSRLKQKKFFKSTSSYQYKNVLVTYRRCWKTILLKNAKEAFYLPVIKAIPLGHQVIERCFTLKHLIVFSPANARTRITSVF
jgi:hypothetical protein